jgi:GTPase SAR1 family protein
LLKDGARIEIPGIGPTIEERDKYVKRLKENTWGSTSIVGIVGTYNVGKTFVLNKLSGYQCPSGATISTKGLSFKYVKNPQREFVLLDTAGMNSPVTFPNEQDLSPLADRKSADTFLQELVYQLSDVFITVVNHISFKEQESLQQLKAKLEKIASKKAPYVIVIHNWKECTDLKDLELLFQKQIVSLHPKGKSEVTDNIWWFNNNNSRHVAFGNDVKLGAHNLAVIKLISFWIDSFKAHTERKFKFAESLENAVSVTLPDFVVAKESEKSEKSGESKFKVKLDLDKLTLTADFKQLKPFSFSPESGVLLSSNVRFLEFRTNKGKKILLEIPGTKIKPYRFPDRIQVTYEPMNEIAAIFKDYQSTPPEFKAECGIIPDLEPQNYTFKVEAEKYDAEKAEFANHKGYFVIDIPYRTVQSGDDGKEY